MQAFNEGLLIMRVYLFRDMMMEYYKVEPADLSIYSSLIMTPYLFKFVYGFIIDSRIVPKRKYYFMLFGLVNAGIQYIISIFVIKDDVSIAWLMIVFNFGFSFMDATLNSIVVQQARRDKVNG